MVWIHDGIGIVARGFALLVETIGHRSELLTQALGHALASVACGHQILPPSNGRPGASALNGSLSARELDWLNRLDRHSSVADIAATERCSERSMHRWLNKTYAKLGATRREQALAVAHRHRFI